MHRESHSQIFERRHGSPEEATGVPPGRCTGRVTVGTSRQMNRESHLWILQADAPGESPTDFGKASHRERGDIADTAFFSLQKSAGGLGV